jgi:hypothetical protein
MPFRSWLRSLSTLPIMAFTLCPYPILVEDLGVRMGLI